VLIYIVILLRDQLWSWMRLSIDHLPSENTAVGWATSTWM